MTDVTAITTFMFGGNAILTLRSVKTGVYYTYKIKKGKNYHFVSVLNGPDNTSNYTYLGTIFDCKSFRITKKSAVGANAPSMIAFDWAFRSIMGKKIVPSSLEVWHEGRCGRCGRLLTVVESIATGFGPECSEIIGVKRVNTSPVDIRGYLLKGLVPYLS